MADNTNQTIINPDNYISTVTSSFNVTNQRIVISDNVSVGITLNLTSYGVSANDMAMLASSCMEGLLNGVKQLEQNQPLSPKPEELTPSPVPDTVIITEPDSGYISRYDAILELNKIDSSVTHYKCNHASPGVTSAQYSDTLYRLCYRLDGDREIVTMLNHAARIILEYGVVRDMLSSTIVNEINNSEAISVSHIKWRVNNILNTVLNMNRYDPIVAEWIYRLLIATAQLHDMITPIAESSTSESSSNSQLFPSSPIDDMTSIDAIAAIDAVDESVLRYKCIGLSPTIDHVERYADAMHKLCRLLGGSKCPPHIEQAGQVITGYRAIRNDLAKFIVIDIDSSVMLTASHLRWLITDRLDAILGVGCYASIVVAWVYKIVIATAIQLGMIEPYSGQLISSSV